MPEAFEHESRARASVPPEPARGGFAAWVPGIWVLRHYQRAWLAKDAAAGLVLSALLVPAGMGYAEAAGLPPVTGLYATIVPLLAYALFGPSRVLVLGPDSALAAMIAAAIVSRAGNDPARATGLASTLAIMTGLLCLVAGLARAGFVTDLLSKPVRVGYMNGIATTVLVTQLPKLLGFSVSGSDAFHGALGTIRGVAAGETKPAALVIGASSIAVILACAKWLPRIPGVLLAVVSATLATTFLGLAGELSVVGPIPRGIPRPALPSLTLADAQPLAVAAFGIALVSFADTSVLSRSISARRGERVDPSRELVGLALANIAAGFFQGFPVSSSSSRTPVAIAAGSRTQVTGIVGALAIVLLLALAPDLVRNLPVTALAAVVMTAALRLYDVEATRIFFHVRRSDFVVSMVAFAAVLALGVLEGVAIAVAVSLLDVFRRAWRPHDAVLGRAEGVKGYHDVTRYPGAKQVPGLVLFRWDAPLIFANADTFRERILELVEAEPRPKWVVVAAEPITDVDTTAAEMLGELDVELAEQGIELAFAELKDPVKDRLQRYGLHERFGREYFFPTLGVAVKAFREQTGTPWVDWEEAGD